MNALDFYCGAANLDFFHGACSQNVKSKSAWTTEELDDLMCAYLCGGEL